MSCAQNVSQGQQKYFGFMDIILLHSGNQYVSATHVAISRAARTSSQTFTSIPSGSLCIPYHWLIKYVPSWTIISPFSIFPLALCLRTYQNRLCVYIYIFSYLLFNHEFYQNLHDFSTVEWFIHILIILVFLFSPPWRWPHEWPTHIEDHYAIKLYP